MKDLIIFGAGGLGREVAWLVERLNKVSPVWNLLGFMDDCDKIQGSKINGYDVLGTINDINKYANVYFVCAIGSSKIREEIINKMKFVNQNIKFATLVDPSVDVSNSVSIGEGTIVCVHTIITVNISIGNHVIINYDCTIGHDAILNDFVTLYPSVNVSGITNIGYCSELGTGSQIIQKKNVGRYAIVGAGSVVVKDIPEKCTAVGIPAKPIKFFE